MNSERLRMAAIASRVERLRELLIYNPETGDVTRRSGSRAGELASYVGNRGYRMVRCEGRRDYAHRIIWLLVTGVPPVDEIDHINLKRDDNRWANLREATRSQNLANAPLSSRNTSGYKGVCWNKRERKWQAQISISGKRHHLGGFDCPKAAHGAYVEAAQTYSGEYARAA